MGCFAANLGAHCQNDEVSLDVHQYPYARWSQYPRMTVQQAAPTVMLLIAQRGTSLPQNLIECA